MASGICVVYICNVSAPDMPDSVLILLVSVWRVAACYETSQNCDKRQLASSWNSWTATGMEQLDCRWTGTAGLPLDWNSWTATGLEQLDCHWTGTAGLPLDWNRWTATGRMFRKFEICVFFENLS